MLHSQIERMWIENDLFPYEQQLDLQAVDDSEITPQPPYQFVWTVLEQKVSFLRQPWHISLTKFRFDRARVLRISKN